MVARFPSRAEMVLGGALVGVQERNKPNKLSEQKKIIIIIQKYKETRQAGVWEFLTRIQSLICPMYVQYFVFLSERLVIHNGHVALGG